MFVRPAAGGATALLTAALIAFGTAQPAAAQADQVLAQMRQCQAGVQDAATLKACLQSVLEIAKTTLPGQYYNIIERQIVEQIQQITADPDAPQPENGNGSASGYSGGTGGSGSSGYSVYNPDTDPDNVPTDPLQGVNVMTPPADDSSGGSDDSSSGTGDGN